MNDISCDICLDLLPLVWDNVASEDSRIAVMEHVKTCESCRALYKEESFREDEMNDNYIVSRIKKQLYFVGLITIIFGAILGLALTEGIGMFYNILIMPAIGLIGYLALSKKSYYVPVTLFIFIYAWLLIKYIGEGMFSDAPFISAILTPGYWALLYSGLCSLGVFIGFLLRIAFKREERHDKVN